MDNTTLSQEPDTLMYLDERLYGPDDMEKPIPSLGDDCLVFDGEHYFNAIVIAVDEEKKVFEALLLDQDTSMTNIHFCRFRPIF